MANPNDKGKLAQVVIQPAHGGYVVTAYRATEDDKYGEPGEVFVASSHNEMLSLISKITNEDKG